MAPQMASATGRISVITVPAAAVGPWGLTLGAAFDPGGGGDPHGLAVPAVQLRMADERQWCELVSFFVHHGNIGEFQACPAYRGGRCARAGGETVCAFLEGPDAPIWERARGYYFLPGVGMVHHGLWAAYGIEPGVTP